MRQKETLNMYIRKLISTFHCGKDNNRNKHDAGMSTITGSCSRTQSRITSKTFGDAAWLRRIPARSPKTFEKVNYITPFL